MRFLLVIPSLIISLSGYSQNDILHLPVAVNKINKQNQNDWLIKKDTFKSKIYKSGDSKNIILDNGLLRRSFRLQPNLACIDFTNLTSGEQMLRAISPEARVTIDGKKYEVGGLHGQLQKAYLKSVSLDTLKSGNNDFHFQSFTISSIHPYVTWIPAATDWALNKKQPEGKMISFLYKSNVPSLKDIIVIVNYELYDGIPLICKWLSVENKSSHNIHLDQVTNEILATPEEESSVAGSTSQMKVPHGIYIESNYAFNNSMNARLSDQTTHWKADPSYRSQVNYQLQTPCLLEVYPPIGPGVILEAGQSYKSIRTNELLLDSYDRERNGLAQRRMYRTIAPWATQNPIFMHLISVDPNVVGTAIDQCAETGYEGIILSFGSGLNMEDISDRNIFQIKKLVDYAHSKNIKLGGYSLFSSRRINDDEDVIDPVTGKPDVHALFSFAPCLGSKWGLEYLSKLKQFITRTGMDIFENDGPYAGDVCASIKHPGHKGLADSQWQQMELQKGFYRWCAANGIYVNAPDWYFMDGTNKISIGYREVNFSLPREEQAILNRQNISDGTWEKMPSMSWGFVPLTEYKGGGKAATLEPLNEHLHSYEQLMMQYYGAGVQACYRGPRLYDTEETKKLVVKVIDWYKKYRTILNSDIIHLRRADGRDWDGILHVNPDGKIKGLVMLYNPLMEIFHKRIKIPLYYTGLTKTANIRQKEGESKRYLIDSQSNVIYDVDIPANGYTWLVIE